jgi:hypothetical protein
MISVSMEQSPWEIKSRSPGQEIPRVFLNPKIYYRVHKSPQLIFWARWI